MTANLKLASNLAPFSKLSDRFVPAGYTDGCDLLTGLKKLSEIEGISGVALGWPCQLGSAEELRKVLDDLGLELATLDTDIYTDRRFARGSLSNRDPKIRREAVDRIRATLDAAASAGASDINLWLAHDGFEYFFQAHYADAWKWIVDGLQQAAEHNPDVPISLEPKCKEPRANQYVSNVGRALMLVNRINRPQVGITLDFGHSIAAMESPAEAAVLAMMEGRLQQVHLNDNYRDWDLDLVPGAVNVWDHVEFFYWLRKLGYGGWYSVDIFPYRQPGAKVVEVAAKTVRTCCDLADNLIETNMEQEIRDGKHLEILTRLWDRLG